MFDLDWQKLFVPSASVAEIFVRGTVVYLALFMAMRFLPRRAIGSMGASDILVIVLISETVSNAMQGGADTLTDGLLLAAVVLGWATFVDWLDYKLPAWHIGSAKELALVRDGKILEENLARQHITQDEVMSQLREHGLESTKNVAVAYLEGGGHMSVIIKGGTPLKARGHQ
jgi:uncharacterized membrane protein YcaP (DUF421 family)